MAAQPDNVFTAAPIPVLFLRPSVDFGIVHPGELSTEISNRRQPKRIEHGDLVNEQGPQPFLLVPVTDWLLDVLAAANVGAEAEHDCDDEPNPDNEPDVDDEPDHDSVPDDTDETEYGVGS